MYQIILSCPVQKQKDFDIKSSSFFTFKLFSLVNRNTTFIKKEILTHLIADFTANIVKVDINSCWAFHIYLFTDILCCFVVDCLIKTYLLCEEAALFICSTYANNCATSLQPGNLDDEKLYVCNLFFPAFFSLKKDQCSWNLCVWSEVLEGGVFEGGC